MNIAPIGILDSGFGGLSIYRSVTGLLPYESTIYIGDHAHLPYSEKTTEYIHGRVIKIIQYLLLKKVKLIVIACNTATVAGIEIYRKTFTGLPIIGVVPVVKTAAEVSKKRAFAVLSTNFTAKSEYQKNLIRTFAADCKVYNLGGHSLVDFVERGEISGKVIERELRNILTPTILRDIDVIALGCTHYPFLRESIRSIVGSGIQILDSGGAVARQVEKILKHNQILSEKHSPTHKFYSTSKDVSLSGIASKLLRSPTDVHYAYV